MSLLSPTPRQIDKKKIKDLEIMLSNEKNRYRNALEKHGIEKILWQAERKHFLDNERMYQKATGYATIKVYHGKSVIMKKLIRKSIPAPFYPDTTNGASDRFRYGKTADYR